jgi:hypothetical protein
LTNSPQKVLAHSIFFQLSEERFTWMFQQGDYYFQCPGNVTDNLMITTNSEFEAKFESNSEDSSTVEGSWHVAQVVRVVFLRTNIT